MNILLVDDSTIIRGIIRQIISTDPHFTVIGEAANGQDALAALIEKKPDCVLMDIEMPVMNGFEAARHIKTEFDIPVILMSAAHNAEIFSSILEAGASDFIAKPGLDNMAADNFTEQLVTKLRRFDRSEDSGAGNSGLLNISPDTFYQIVVIGASTGGPLAVKQIITSLPRHFPLSIVIAQHFESGFEKGYVNWLNEGSPVKVHLIQDDTTLEPGRIFIAPADKKIVLENNRFIVGQAEQTAVQSPCIDTFFRSVSKVYADKTIGVLLSGMGRDGAAGACFIRKNGGYTIVQDKTSSAVFGMPKAAIDMNGASIVLPLSDIADSLRQLSELKEKPCRN